MRINIHHLISKKTVHTATGSVTLSLNASTEFDSISLEGHNEQSIVVEAKFLDKQTKVVVAHSYSWPDPLKFLPHIKPNISFTLYTQLEPRAIDQNGEGVKTHLFKLVVKTDCPAKGIHFWPIEGSFVHFSDNGLTLLCLETCEKSTWKVLMGTGPS